MRNSLKTLLVASLLTAGACGGGSDGKDLSRFTGIWLPTAGTQTKTCGGQPSTFPVTDSVTWSLGSTSDLVQPVLSQASCFLHADVDGDTASIVGAATCMVPGTDDYGYTVNSAVTLTAYTFALSPDGKTATENFSGSILETDNGTGTTASCTFSETAGSYQRQ
jgi:hypothetical protein